MDADSHRGTAPSTITVGFWRPRPYVALDAPDAAGPAGRGLRLPRSERRRQDDHAQAADAADLSRRPGAPRSSAGRSATSSVRRRIGYLPENPYFYDYLTAEELLEYFAGAVRLRRQRAPAPGVARCSTRWASAPSGGCSCGSSPRACCSASASRRRSSTIRRSSSSTSRCPGSIRSAGARSGELILRLRDRGCTVFFSSHVLSDAEALCSRVAILAEGAAGRRGRPVGDARVPGSRLGARRARRRRRVARAGADARRRGAGHARSATTAYALELPLSAAPERVLARARRARRHSSSR